MSALRSSAWCLGLVSGVALVSASHSASAQGASPKVTTIVGKIDDTTGTGLAGATVIVKLRSTGESRRTTTSVNGEYIVVFNDTSTLFSVSADAPGHAATSLAFSRRPTLDRIVANVRLRAVSNMAATDSVQRAETVQARRARDSVVRAFESTAKFAIVGSITDQSDHPLAGAHVVASPGPGSPVTPAPSGLEEAWIWTATTDDKGRFTLSLPAALTKFTLSVSAVGFVRVNQAFTSHGPGDMMYNVKMGVAAIIVSAPFPRTVVTRAELGVANAADFWIGEGDITVTGTDDDVISYQVLAPPGTRASDHPEDRGLHIVSGFGIRAPGGPGAFLIVTVPRSLKTLRLAVGHSGAIHVDHFDGELTLSSEQGSIDLTDITGPTLVEARDGPVQVAFSKLPAIGAHGLSVLGRNGDVTVTLPPDAKGSLSLEVHRGTVTSAFTDGNGRIEVNASDIEALRRLAPQGTPPTASEIPRKFIRDINGGGVLVQVVALNGNIIVKKRAP